MKRRRSVLGGARGDWRFAGVLGLSLATVTAGLVALPTARAASVELEPDALEQAKALHERGRALYETSDFLGAIDVWIDAFGLLPASARQARNALVYNIAAARERAYEVGRDREQLVLAIALLQLCIANVQELPKTPEAEREVRELQARVDELQRVLDGTATPEVADSPQRFGLFEGDRSAPPLDLELQAQNRELARAMARADSMLIGGAVLVSLGVLSLGGSLSAYSVYWIRRDVTFDDDPPPNMLSRNIGLGLLVAGLAATATGSALLGVGITRQRRIQAGRLSMSPSLHLQGAGLSLRGAF